MAKILLVEDNEMNRDMLSRRLARKGFDVVFAFDGKEGIEKAFSESPDLILMDMNLPEVDGWEATRTIRRREAAEQKGPVRIMGLTAHAMKGDLERCLEAGCDDYDTKPVEFARLLEKIRTLLGPEQGAPS